jgi:hypothetical protein
MKGAVSEAVLKRGLKLVHDLSYGADAYQKTELPPTTIQNADSAYKHGEVLTDKIALWVELGFAAGPFEVPPVPGFRANALMAIEKNGSVRPVINMSLPLGDSFNDNLEEERIEKVWMTTAKDFSYTLKEAGENCTMSKYDLKDAFKNIPAKKEDWGKQGFKWLGRFFLETQMIFGASPSVSNFDRLGSTLLELAVLKSGFPRFRVHRTLDDIPLVAPYGSQDAKSFGAAFKEICEKTGVKIATNCPNKEKAFENETSGVVLGIGFNTERLEWFLPAKKADKITQVLKTAVNASSLDLNSTQKLMGQLNELTKMSPYVRFFKDAGNRLLREFGGNKNIRLQVNENLRSDIRFCAGLVFSARRGIPLASRPGLPPLSAISFFSDAAGSKFTLVQGKRVNHNMPDDRGAACLLVEGDSVSWYSTIRWPLSLLNEAVDRDGKFFGSKTTTLEVVGLLLPFLCCPEKLMGQSIVFHVDNIAVMYGWNNGSVKFDETASMLLKFIQLAAAYLGTQVYVRHIHRCSDKWSSLADHLTRRSTCDPSDKRLLRRADKSEADELLLQWLAEPVVCADTPYVFLGHLVRKFNL